MSLYFKILIFSFILPFLFSFHPKINFHKKWIPFFKANLITLIPFLIWDEIFTVKNIWGFNNEHLSGIYLSKLPIEEVLFFIIIPYCCIFTYEVIKQFSFTQNKECKQVTLFLSVLTFILGVSNTEHMYTFVTMISLGILLFYQFIVNKEFLYPFYLMYIIIHLTGFIIVNGLLTGFSLDTPPVWYNYEETLNIRLGSIPIEDFFYSMLLLLCNTLLFEAFNTKKIKL